MSLPNDESVRILHRCETCGQDFTHTPIVGWETRPIVAPVLFCSDACLTNSPYAPQIREAPTEPDVVPLDADVPESLVPIPWRGEAVERGEIGPQNDLSRAVETLWLAVPRDKQLELSREGFSLDPILLALRPVTVPQTDLQTAIEALPRIIPADLDSDELWKRNGEYVSLDDVLDALRGKK